MVVRAHTVGMGMYGQKDYGGIVDEDFNRASLVYIAIKKPKPR